MNLYWYLAVKSSLLSAFPIAPILCYIKWNILLKNPSIKIKLLFWQAKRRLELGESGHQYLAEGLKTPKGKGRAATRSPDSPKSKGTSNTLYSTEVFLFYQLEIRANQYNRLRYLAKRVGLLLSSPTWTCMQHSEPRSQAAHNKFAAQQVCSVVQSCWEAAEAPGCWVCPSACWAACGLSIQDLLFSQGHEVGDA